MQLNHACMQYRNAVQVHSPEGYLPPLKAQNQLKLFIRGDLSIVISIYLDLGNYTNAWGSSFLVTAPHLIMAFLRQSG